jgi:magnesium chelatase subunit I
MAAPALRHRLRRNPLDETGSATRIDRALAEVFGP